MANEQNLTSIQKGQVLNPNGRPRGSKNISTYIRELLEDESFEATLLDSKQGVVQYKGAPIKAIIHVAIQRSLHDDKNGHKWADWLGKYGYGMMLKLQEEDKTVKVVHIFKPEKLGSIDLINAQGSALQQRAEKAAEGDIVDAVDSTTRPADVRSTNT